MNTKITNPAVTSTLPHKYLGIFGMIWISLLLTITFTGLKTFEIFGATVSAGIVAYPLTYIFSDIFTEVYGYRVSRKIVWTGFFCILFSTMFASFLTYMPAPVSFTNQNEFNLIFRSGPIMALLIILPFWAGELINSFVVAKLKVFTEGKNESLRYVSSTFFGLLADSLIFWWGAHFLLGWFEPSEIWYTTFVGLIFCVAWEIIALPITNRIVDFIKEQEGIDTYDIGTDFNPLKF